jgi:hypothetical protein
MRRVERFRCRPLAGGRGVSLRLAGRHLHDEWQVGRRYFSAESLVKLPSLPSATAREAVQPTTLSLTTR